MNVKQWVFIGIALVLIGATVFLLVIGKDGDGNVISEKTECFDGELKSLYFEAGACEIKLLEGAAGQTTVQYENIKPELWESSFSNGVLKIKMKEDSRGKLFGRSLWKNDKKVRITLTLPAEVILEKATMECGAASVEAERIHAKQLELTVGAGAFWVTELVAEQSAKLTVGAGAFYAEKVRLTNAKLECGVGEMKLAGVVYGESEAECGMGAMELNLTEQKKEDFFGKLSCGIGKLMFGDITINGTGEKNYGVSAVQNRLNVDCGLGEVKVRFE